MLEESALNQKRVPVHRVQSLPPNTDALLEIFRQRGISARAAVDIQSIWSSLNLASTANDLIDDAFRGTPDKYPTPFKPSRFTDGNFAIFYSALEEETSIAEVQYHQMDAFNAAKQNGVIETRYFYLYQVDFNGALIDLFELSKKHAEIISLDDSGYPFCRNLAVEGRALDGAMGFVTPSARRQDGTCTPIWKRDGLVSQPKVRATVKFQISSSSVSVEVLK